MHYAKIKKCKALAKSVGIKALRLFAIACSIFAGLYYAGYILQWGATNNKYIKPEPSVEVEMCWPADQGVGFGECGEEE